MTGFSLNLDLTLYFEDLRKYACVFVDSTKCKEVGDVENHIKAVFKLEDNICLTNKKFLIPRCESISILQQYDTLKVQKCDFYDYQIHKNKKSNPSGDQSALNLIQSDRTIDLSCRPKQRFRINIRHNQCILEAPATQLENNQIENYPQQIVVSNENVLDENSEAQTKLKIKNKKRKYDIQNGELEDNNDENLTKILDMSVKKSKKKNKNTFAMVDETSKANVDSPTSCITQVEFDTKKVKKSKKKKKLLQDEEIDLSNTCWESLITNEKNSKKRKCQKNSLNEDCNGGLAKDLSFSVNSNLENGDEESKQNVNTYEGLKRKKRYNENKCIESDDQELPDKIRSKLSSEQNILKTANSEMTKDLNVGFKISTKRIEDYKRGLEDKISRLLLQKDNKSSYVELEEDPTNLLNTCTATNPSPIPQGNDVCITMNGEQFQGDNQVFTQTDCKRKRIRKHNKKKKREKRELLCAIGPVLNRITTPPEIKSSPSSSDLTKHIYFNDKDFIEEMTIPSTPPATSQSLLQGNLENESQNQSQDNTDPNTSRGAVCETKTWQEEFLKKTTITSHPLVFHRSTISSAISDKNDSPSISFSTRTSTPLVQNVVTIEGECSAAIVVRDIPKQLQSVSKSLTSCNGEQTVSNHLEDSKPRINFAKLDFKNVILTDFPVIDKVVAEDFILFKVLKLSEKCEPLCSNPILAKVKDATHFPDKVSLQIVEGIEECDSLTRSFDDSEECLVVVELSWSDIVEPRLFYP